MGDDGFLAEEVGEGAEGEDTSTRRTSLLLVFRSRAALLWWSPAACDDLDGAAARSSPPWSSENGATVPQLTARDELSCHAANPLAIEKSAGAASHDSSAVGESEPFDRDRTGPLPSVADSDVFIADGTVAAVSMAEAPVSVPAPAIAAAVAAVPRFGLYMLWLTPLHAALDTVVLPPLLLEKEMEVARIDSETGEISTPIVLDDRFDMWRLWWGLLLRIDLADDSS